MLIYRAVPLKLFRSRYGICCLVLGSRYCLAIPKSTTWTTEGHHGSIIQLWPARVPQNSPFAFFVPGRPIKKLSGLMSR